AVVADVHADAQAAEVVDGKGTVAGCREVIDAQAGQVQLAVAGEETLGADEGAGVVEAAGPRVEFEQANHGKDVERTAIRGEGVRCWAGQRFGDGERFGTTLEAVAGHGALGENDEPCALLR